MRRKDRVVISEHPFLQIGVAIFDDFDDLLVPPLSELVRQRHELTSRHLDVPSSVNETVNCLRQWMREPLIVNYDLNRPIFADLAGGLRFVRHD